jgi:hypothetical protein
VSYSGEYEMREAARFLGYQWKEFLALDGEEQSEIVAHYRAHGQIEGTLAKEAMSKNGG